MRLQHLSALLLGGLATASPLAIRQAGTATESSPCARRTPPATEPGSGSGSGSGVDAAAIQAIIPGSNSCAGAQFPDECRTAEQAAPFISKACAELSKAECAATIALMGYESGIRVKHNLSPGVPGQGTANMMSPAFVSEYATELFGADKVTGQSPVAVLALVTPDEHNFGSAAWFLINKCPDVRAALKTGSNAGWEAYNTKCIGGGPETLPGRTEFWTRAKAALGV